MRTAAVDAGRCGRRQIAADLAESGLSERKIRELTRMSRDTIRKAKNDKKGDA